MTRTISLMLMSVALASCGKSSAPDSAANAQADSPGDAPAAATAAGDACTLLDDPNTLFGQSVTAETKSMPNQTSSCEWKSADGRLCGMVTVFGPGWNEVPDLKANYSAMATSVGVFGDEQPLAGVGEEAVIVDGGMLGAQVALRTSKAIANIGAACAGSGPGNLEHARKIAHAVAAKL